MILEFQMQAAAFLAAQKTALQALKVCPPPPTTIGQVQVVIDRFEFGANALRHNVETEFSIFYNFLGEETGINVPGFQAQLAQDIVVYVTTMDDVMSHANGSPATLVPFTGTMVIDLSVFAVEQDVYFQTRFKTIEPGPLPPLPENFAPMIDQILQMVNQQVPALVQFPTVPLGILGLLPVAPSKLLIVNAGMSVDSNLQRVGVQVEVGPGSVNPDGRWRDFFKGVLSDRLAGNEWSVFVPASYIEQTIQVTLQGLVDGFAPSDVRIDVGAHYSNAGGNASIGIDLRGFYNGLPDPLPQLQAHAHIPVGISVPLQNTMQVDVGLPDIQTFIERLIPAWAQVFIHLSGPVGALLGAFIHTAISGIEDPGLPAGVVRTSPENLRFTKSVKLPEVPGQVSPRFTTLLAQDYGIAIAGPLNARPFTKGALSISSIPFRLHAPSINCGGAGIELVALFGESPQSFDILSAEVFVQYDGTLPVYLCSVTPINDPLGVFPTSSLRQDSPQTNAAITVHPPVPPPAYYAAAYTCDLLIKTTAGLRLVRLAPPPPLTQKDIDKLQAALLVKLGNCEMLVDPWFTKHQGYNPAWSVDPPSEEVLHLWQVDITGLAAEETVTLVDVQQQAVATYQVGQFGQQVQLSALVSPAALHANELSIVRGRQREHGVAPAQEISANEKHSAPRRGIAVTQQLVIRLGSIALGQPCRKVMAARIQGSICVVAVLDDAVAAFDVSNPKSVYRVGHWNVPGVRGVVNRQSELLFFGERGLTVIDGMGRQTESSCGCEADDVLDVAMGADLIYAAMPDMLGIFSPRLCRVGAIAMDCSSVVRLGDRLVAAVGGNLTIAHLRHPRQPKVHSECEDWRVTEIRSAAATDSSTFLAMLEDGTARLLRMNGDRISEAASFPTKPWFLDTARVGDLIVRMAGNDLEIDRFGASAVL